LVTPFSLLVPIILGQHILANRPNKIGWAKIYK
jgi:hypothetical protein